jgi:hypothetical protein
VRLVAYVRPHGDKILSEFAERVKGGGVMGSLGDFFETMSASKYLDYMPRFEAWQNVFGDHFDLRPFVRGQLYQGDVVADFFRFALKSEAFELPNPGFTNTSLTISQLSLVREVHKHLSKEAPLKKGARARNAGQMVGRSVAGKIQLKGLGQDSDKLRLSALIASQISERYAADAAALDAGFFEGTPMTQALEKIHLEAADSDQSLEAGEYFSADVVNSVHIFAAVLADILKQNAR